MDNLWVLFAHRCREPLNVNVLLLHSFIGSIQHWSMTGLMWNLALDGNGSPKLPGTNSCGTPCRPVATVNSDGSWSVNQECECY